MYYVINNKKFNTLKNAIDYQCKLENINKNNFVDILNGKIKPINTQISGIN